MSRYVLVLARITANSDVYLVLHSAAVLGPGRGEQPPVLLQSSSFVATHDFFADNTNILGICASKI